MSGPRVISSGSDVRPVAAASQPDAVNGESTTYVCWVNTGSSDQGETWQKAVVIPPKGDGPSPLAKWVVLLAPLSIPFWIAVGWAVWRLFQ